MRRYCLITLAGFLIASVAGADPTAYLVSPMDCKGEIAGQHYLDSYVRPVDYAISLTVISFRSGDSATPADEHSFVSFAGNKAFYSGAMQIDGDRVWLPALANDLSGPLDLVRTESRNDGQWRIDTLTGSMGHSPYLYYKLRCAARVVTSSPAIKGAPP